MKSMIKNIIITTVIGLMAVSSVAAQEFTGYFSIDSVDGYLGEPVGVPVYLNNNNVDFSTLFIPIRYDGDLMSYDSVSFEGSIMPDDFTGAPFDFPDENLLQITYLPIKYSPIPSISTSGGLIGTIWFTLDDQAAPGFAPIDSASIDSLSTIGLDTTIGWIGAMMANSTGDTSWFPDCIGGGINVLVPTAVNDDLDNSLPSNFALAQNYPNPFNPRTVISYSLAESGRVNLEVFNVLGQSVVTLVDGVKPAGDHQVEFDASIFPSGIFFYRLTQNELRLTKKMVLVK